ncbi:titin-like [Amphiura filiformis]|uniref:titin-like n=1 Tax=Amphiura filiformis TaxID=82378 RepID=UPI003B222D5A
MDREYRNGTPGSPGANGGVNNNMALQVRNGTTSPPGGATANTNGSSGRARPFLTCYDTDSGVVLIVAKRASIAASAEGPAVGMLSFSESYGGDVSGAYDPGMESDTDVDVDEILPFDGVLNLPGAIQRPLEFVSSHKASHKTQLVSPNRPRKFETPPTAGTPPPSPQDGINVHRYDDAHVLEKAVESITKPQEEAVPFINLLPENKGFRSFDKRTTITTKTTETKEDSPVDVIPATTPVKMQTGDTVVQNGHQLNNSPQSQLIIRPDGSSSLIIPKTLPKHSGTLTCKAENMAGLASCTAKLTVEAPTAPAPMSYSDTEQIQRVQSRTTTRMPVKVEYSTDVETNHLDQRPGRTSPPTITSHITSQDVFVGGTTRFECVITGRPRPSVKWFKNGKELTPDGIRIIIKIEQSGRSWLELRSVKPDDDAQYMVKATNPAGEASSVARLTVKIQGTIDSDLSDSSHQMRLRVGMDKNPGPYVRLISTDRQKGPIIHHAARHTTPISISAASDTSDVEMHESRTYTRKTTTTTVTEETKDDGDDGRRPPRRPPGGGGPPGGESALVVHRYPVVPVPPINININIGLFPEVQPEAPRFRERLSDQVVTEGGTITISCTISAHPFPNIAWYKGDTLVRDSQDFQYLINGNRVSLKIKIALPQDTGEYTCRATNMYGSSTCTCRITVYPSTMTSLDEIEDTTRRVKKTTTTTTTVTSDVEAPSEISYTSTEKVIHTRPPRFLNDLLDIEVLENSVARFDARITGHPLPTITWFIDGIEVQPGDRYTIQFDDLGHCSLTIHRVTRTDAAEIECRAINPYGTISSYADLVVKPIRTTVERRHRKHREHVIVEHGMRRPKFVEPMEPQTVLVGETVTIKVRVSAAPPPTVTWYKDGRTLIEDDRHVTTYRQDGTCILTIVDVQEIDEAEYMCKAVNELGKAVSYAELTVRITFEVPDYQREVSLLSTSIPEEDSWTESEYYVDRVVSGTDIVETITRKTTKTITRTISRDDSASESASVTVEIPPKPVGPKPTHYEQVEFETPDYPRDMIEESIEMLPSQRTEVLVEPTPPPPITVIPTPRVEEEPITPMKKPEVPKKPVPIPVEIKEEQVIPVTKPEEEKPLPVLTEPEKPPVVMEAPFEPVTLQREFETLVLSEPELVDELVPEETRLVEPEPFAPVVVAPEEEGPQELEIFIEYLPPVFTQEIIDVEVVEKEKVTFEAVVEGHEPIEVTWYKDTIEIEESPEITITFDGHRAQLVIEEVTLDRKGTYEITAVNEGGRVTSRATLFVEAAPESEEIIEVSRSVEVTEVTETTTEERFVEVSEISVSEMSYEEEFIAPYFTKIMEDTVVTDGAEVTFEVIVVGNPPPEVRWFVDGSEILDEPEYEIIFDEGTCTLTLLEVIPEDEGEYVCLAVNEVGEATCKAMLYVEVSTDTAKEKEKEPPKDEKQVEEETEEEIETEVEVVTKRTVTQMTVTQEVPEEVVVEEEAPTKVEVIAEETTPEGPQVETVTTEETTVETKVTEEVVTTEDVKVVETAIIEPEEPSKEIFIALGNYLAEAPNVMSLREGERLTVLETPEEGDWILAKRETNGEEGWVPRTYLSTAEQYESTLFEQLAETVAAMPTQETPVEGEPVAPVFTEPLHTTKAKDGKPVTLQCLVEGNPKPTIAWFRQSTPIPECEDFDLISEGNVASLTIKEVFPEDSGKYTCVAKNIAGVASTAAELLVEVNLSDAESGDGVHTPASRKSLSRESTVEEPEGIKPAFMAIPKGKRVEESHPIHTFEFRLIAAPRPTISWFKDDSPLEESERFHMSMIADVHLYIVELDIEDIQPEDEGTYRIEAKNKEGQAVASVTLEVNKEEPVEPSFIEPLQPSTIKEGQTAHFECRVTGTPKPDVSWFKDNVMLQKTQMTEMEHDGVDKYWITLNEALPIDSGTFTCMAENIAGRCISGAELQVVEEPRPSEGFTTDSEASSSEMSRDREDELEIEFEIPGREEEGGEKPKFIQPANTIEVKKGEEAKLAVKVLGHPLPEVSWYRDGKVVQPDAKHTIMSDDEGNASLVIAEATTEDDAEYLCKAINAYGIATCKADIIVEEEEMIARREEPKQELQAPARDTDQGSTSEAPSISEDETEDRGPKLWEDTLTTVIEKAPIEEAPVTVEEKKPEEQVPVEAVLPEEPKEEAEPLKPEEGELLEAPKFVEDMVDMEIIKGHPARFDVQVSGIPMPTLTWFRDGVELQPDDHFSMEFSEEEGIGSLVISEVITDDDAEYTCKANNKAGETVSKADIFLQPLRKKEPQKQAPVFLEELKPFDCIEKESVNFICKVFGVPEPDIIWYRDNVELQLGPRHSLDYDEDGVCTLLIREIQIEDTGDYTCQATNDAGVTRTCAPLTVQAPAQIVEGPTHLAVKRGETVAPKFEFIGIPRPEIYWTKGITEMEITERVCTEVTEEYAALTIADVEPSDAGDYTVITENPVGRDERTFKLDVFDSPGTPSRPTATDISKSSISITWQAPSKDGGTPITSYCVELYVVPTQTWLTLSTTHTSTTYIAIDLLPETEYTFRITALNAVGASQPSEQSQIIMTHKELVPEKVSPEKAAEFLPKEEVTVEETVVEETTVVTEEKVEVTEVKEEEVTIKEFEVDKKRPSLISPVPIEVEIIMLPKEEPKEVVTVEVAPMEEFAPEELAPVEAPKEEVAEVTVAPTEEVTLAPEKVEEAEQLAVTVGRPTEAKPEEVPKEEVVGAEEPVEVRGKPAEAELPEEEKVTPIAEEKPAEAVPVEVAKEEEVTPEAVTVRGVPAEEALPEEEKVAPLEEVKPEEVTVEEVPVEEKAEEVPQPVMFTAKIEDKETFEAKPVKLVSQVAGTPPIDITWYKDDELLVASEQYVQTFEEDTATLEIVHPYPTDSGGYRCTAVNVAGEDSCVAVIHVKKQQMPPRFIETAKPVQVDEGGQAVFKMKIEGEPKPTVSWSKGWKQITDGGRYVVTYDDDLDEAILAIEELVPTDAGKYTCKLISDLGEEKATVSLVVVQKPKEKETPFSLRKAKQVQKAEEQEWTEEQIFDLLKEEPVREYESVLRTHGIVDFRAILKYKEMVKLRLAEEEIKKKEEEEIKKKEAKVEEAPKVVEEAEVVFETAKEFLPIQVKPHHTIEIVCEVADETTPATWYHDEVKIVHDGVKYEMTTVEKKRTLVLHDVQPEDAGDYVCEVGQRRTTAKVEVLKAEEKEVVFETPEEFQPIQVKPHHTIEIVCEVPDETTPATWYHDEVKIVHDGVKYEMTTVEKKRTLVLHDVQPEDAGDYVCEVGPRRTTAKVEVLKAEEKEVVFETPEEFQPIQVKPHHTIEIVCEVPDETTPATWYHDEVKIIHDGVKYEMTTVEKKRTLVLHDVQPEDAGDYVCEVGPRRTTAKVEVLKAEEKEVVFETPEEFQPIQVKPHHTIEIVVKFLMKLRQQLGTTMKSKLCTMVLNTK